MSRTSLIRRLARDRDGASVVEFGLLAPVMIALLMGILWVGVQMQSYNELRSIASDVSRYTVVEYQKSNKLTTDQIATVAAAIAVRTPYNLAGDNLDVAVTELTSPVTGAREFRISLSYASPILIKSLGVGSPSQTFNQIVFVPA
jgi:Flp pilus assembly protein TadG